MTRPLGSKDEGSSKGGCCEYSRLGVTRAAGHNRKVVNMGTCSTRVPD